MMNANPNPNPNLTPLRKTSSKTNVEPIYIARVFKDFAHK